MNVKFTHHLVDTYFEVKCENNHNIFNTNARKPSMEVGKKFYPISTMLVYCMMLLEVGYDDADKLTSFLSLRSFKETTYIRYATHITNKTIKHTQSILKRCREKVYEHYSQIK